MKTVILNNLYAIYLAISISKFARIDVTMWEFYAIGIPTILLVSVFNTTRERTEK